MLKDKKMAYKISTIWKTTTGSTENNKGMFDDMKERGKQAE